MSKYLTFFNTIVFVLLCGVCFSTKAQTAAETSTESKSPAARAQTLDQLLEIVRQNKLADSEVNRRRLREFERKRDEQAQLLASAKADVQHQESIGEQLNVRISDNERELADLETQLAERLGNFGELFGVTRQVAADTRAQIENSLISAQFPGRETILNDIAASKALPTLEQLRKLWVVLLQEQTEQGKVTRFSAEINDEQGHPKVRELIRIGPFTAVSNGKFVLYNSETAQLSILNRQPSAVYTRSARQVENATAGDVVNAAVDPSSGTILGLLVQTPSLLERFDQGGVVGYVVSLLAVVGLGIGLHRLLSLWLTSARVRRQMREQAPAADNPLGRVLQAYDDNTAVDVETLELKLDDAILKEVPKLDRGLNTLKVLAAVAPLMGLLGTVIGMIVTFQSITLWGTGDPKMMAGGISQALMTTVQGLVAAIPLLLLHSLATGRARLIQQVLEEQSAGLIARRAEGGC